eukprot:3914385-Pyramimonas_sp.AAC.1
MIGFSPLVRQHPAVHSPRRYSECSPRSYSSMHLKQNHLPLGQEPKRCTKTQTETLTTSSTIFGQRSPRSRPTQTGWIARTHWHGYVNTN